MSNTAVAVPQIGPAGQELLEVVKTLAKGLCDNPTKVLADISENQGMVCVFLGCDKKDRGLIIGKEGRNIEAIRILLRAIARKHKIKVEILLKED